MTLYEDRRRAESYGEDAERYDRARPDYPVALADDLMAERPKLVLDVGCGTGKAGRIFAERGCVVVGVEPDPRMASVARRRGIQVEVAKFETWDRAGRRFDLLISGQAWHWVDPATGPRRAAEALRRGGRIGLFWTLFKHEPATKTAFEEVYRRFAPELANDSGVLGTVNRGGGSGHIAGLVRTGLFERPRMRYYEWASRLTRDEWLDQIPTHSDHRLLTPDRLAALSEAVGAAIDALGGEIRVNYNVWMIIARRSPSSA
jgi:SAM-dependent methyltransferase